MSSLNEPVTYLGTPIPNYTPTAAEASDAYVSKIGGHPAWLRPVIPAADKKTDQSQCARCPKCKNAANLRLLSQIHAPLEVFDRVIYLFLCASCSTPQESVVFSFRSQLYNPAYDTPKDAPQEKPSSSSESKEALFAVDEDDGWGDEEASEPVAAAPTPAPAKEKKSALVVFPSASAADVAAYVSALVKPPLPMLLLDTFPEPEGPKEKASNKSVAEQLAEVEALYPGITEVSAEAVEVDNFSGGGARSAPIIVDDDDGPQETPDEIASAEFFARLARCPTQCVRWCPNGQPLLSSASRRPPRNIPNCSVCNAPRVFEFQLLSPAIYFFEKNAKVNAKPTARKTPEAGSKAAKQQVISAVEGNPEDPHFATISVYTCSAHCYDAEHTVTLEYTHLEPEL